MMSMIFVFVIIVAPLAASMLTFFSGFGLNTVLLPAFIILLPVKTAIFAVAMVHFLNNLFKLFLIGKKADLKVAAHFGIPAIAAAFFGAWLLSLISIQAPLLTYSLGSRTYSITLINLTIGALMVGFALMELVPMLAKWKVDRKYMAVGGILSGFFGGLSGHQGAFRSVFLLKANLSKEAFIATGVVVACAIDIARLIAYSIDARFTSLTTREAVIVGLSVISAWIGAYFGRSLLHATPLSVIRWMVGVLLMLLGLLTSSGLLN